jgi:3-hydroxybutyryl-CoA dehydratase
VTVKAINTEKKLVTLDTVCTVADKPVIEGEATVMVPARG